MRTHLLPYRIRVMVCAVLMPWQSAQGRDIPAKPGPDAIATAIKEAKSGDVVKLQPGLYRERVKLPEGVVLEGAGPDKTILECVGLASVSTNGANVQIRNIEFRGTVEFVVRAIESESPLRIERCRFVKCDEGVSLRGAPLSDVVHCEFIDCRIGVNVTLGGSPTVWGCLFKGGGWGINVSPGSPYVRFNLFQDVPTAIAYAEDDLGIIRNNIFLRSKERGIMISSIRRSQSSPSIRNCIFDSCGAVVTCWEEKWLDNLSHCVINAASARPFRNERDTLEFKLKAQHVNEVDLGLHVSGDGRLFMKQAKSIAGKGIRLCSEPEGTPGEIGLFGPYVQPGCRPLDPLTAPPIRFVGPRYIANSVREEHEYLRFRSLEHESQSMYVGSEGRFDAFELKGDGEVKKIEFDISRYFGEIMLKP